jgi:Ion transport protein
VLRVYVGGCYFLVREVIQVISLISLKALHIWAYEPSNWLNVIYVILLFTWSGYMSTGGADANSFRTGAAISFGFIWIKFLAYLRNILIAFAVFTGGVFNVIRRLVAFLMCLMIILVAFSRMWFTLFYHTDYCALNPNNFYSDPAMGDSTADSYDPAFVQELKCESNPVRVWCNGWDSFLAVYTMLLGEVDETVFNNNTVAIVMFVIFMLLVVILLANVLIAIVTDSYKVIQDQRAAIVFWTNRLDFIAQMDAIANGPWKSRLRRFFGLRDVDRGTANVKVTFGKDLWDRLMGLFEGDLDESFFSIEFFCYTLLRIMAIIVIPCWIFAGAILAGWLWPPQVRKQLFTRVVSKHSSETEKEEELRKTQVQLLKAEIGSLKDDLLQELAIDRTQVVQMKSSVAERKLEIQNEMKHIKRIVTMLFEQSQG